MSQQAEPEQTVLETLAEDMEGAPPEEAAANLLLLTRELATLDNLTELRLERLEARLGLPDIEEEAEDAEWEELPELAVLVEARGTIESARGLLAAMRELDEAPSAELKSAAETALAGLAALLDLMPSDDESEEA